MWDLIVSVPDLAYPFTLKKSHFLKNYLSLNFFFNLFVI